MRPDLPLSVVLAATSFVTEHAHHGRFIHGEPDRLRGVAVQPDGRIVVVDRTWVQDRAHVDIARMNVDGSIDMDFGVNGAASTKVDRYGAEPFDVLIEPDGRIIVGGTSTDDGDFTLFAFLSDGRAGLTGGSNPDVGIARLNPDGSIDTSFGSGGISGTSTVAWDEAADVLVQPDGRLVVVGQRAAYGTNADIAVARYGASGKLDGSFGNGGLSAADYFTRADVARAVAWTRDGGILAAGMATGRA